MDDNKIVELYFARNEDAIRHTQDAYGRRLFALAENIVRNDQDAQECENDTYFTAWDTIPPQHPTYFFGYLAKICRNFALGRLDWNTAAKRNAPVVSLTQEMECCIPDSSRERELDSRELGRILDRFLRQQSKDNRMVFVRRYWYAETIGEIAARYGIGESAVRMRLNRTRQRLGEYLKKEGYLA